MGTKDRIIVAAEGLLRDGGIGALSFDAIARVLGVSKQAVLYWFPPRLTSSGRTLRGLRP